jgi:hypothetical protein
MTLHLGMLGLLKMRMIKRENGKELGLWQRVC